MIRIAALVLSAIVTVVFAAYPANAQVGSIQGSFDVSTSGSSTFSLPIRTVPGSSGMAPKLTLSYDSQSMGGPVGAGWGVVGVSTITRGTRSLYPHGRVTGVNLDEGDALFLDGQELIAISRSGTGSSQRTEYRKRVDDQSRIIRTGDSFGAATFDVDSKGGLKLVFDTSGDSRIKLGGTALLAAVSSIRDTAGNFISFEYAQNGKGDFNLVRVKYTGHRGAGGIDRQPFASIAFQYDAAPRASESYVAGYVVSRDQRLKSITSGLDPGPAGQSQLVKYVFDYQDTDTIGRFVLARIHEFGSDNSELAPTNFDYTDGKVSWAHAPAQLPIISLASAESLGLGYRAGNYTVGDTQPDLLYGLEIGGQLESFAFKNENGAWVPDDKFKPPFAFATADGADLGTIVADLNGDGRLDLVQRAKRGDGHRDDSAVVAGASGWDPADGYKVPFDLSENGKPSATVRLVHISGGKGPDLAYEANGAAGVLINSGTGWQPAAAPAPPAPLMDGRFVDLDCDGRDEFLAVVPGPAGPVWKGWRFQAGNWQPLQAAFLPPDSTASTPAAFQPARLNAGTCAGFIFAGTSKFAWQGEAGGLVPMPALAPTFSIVRANGDNLGAIVADFDGNGLSDVVVNQKDASGNTTTFAYLLKSDGWHADPAFVPPLLFDLGKKSRAAPILVDVDGNGTADILLPSDSRDSFGMVFLGAADGLHAAPNFVPKMAFARKDQQDRGIRFVDLNGDGLLDVIYRRDVTRDGKLDSVADAQINTGNGWRSVAGLKPLLPFAGDGITGSPVEFVDVNGDGQLDLLYSYDKADGKKIRKLFLNTVAADGSASWVEAKGSPLTPPQDHPFATEGQGGQGVRLLDLDGDGRADMLIGSVAPRAPGDTRPIQVCKNPAHPTDCEWNRDLYRAAAFLNSGTGWTAAPDYAPPVPLVALGTAQSPQSSDLGVELGDVTGDRLPDHCRSLRKPLG